MPSMGMGEKSYRKTTDERVRKVLNTNNPFDQLIFSFAKTGILDVAIVDIGGKTKGFSKHHYSKKSLR